MVELKAKCVVVPSRDGALGVVGVSGMACLTNNDGTESLFDMNKM